MKKLLGIALSSLLVMGLAACSADSEDVSTGEKTKTEKTQTTKAEDGKKIAINKEFNVNGLKVKIGEMKLKKNKVVVGMTVKNTTKDKLSFFPDQGNVVIGNLQLDADLFNGKGNVGGDIQAGVSKSGVVEYAVPDGKSLDVDKVKEVQLHFGDIFNEKSMDAKPFDQVIKLK